MSLGQDIVDIYTKSSVYYLRLQYLVICYLIVLAGAFFILPLPREMGINGNARLIVGGLLYIGFSVFLVYAPKLLYPLIGKLLSPYKDAQEVEEKFNQLSEQEKQKLFECVTHGVGKTYVTKNSITMSKKREIATNIFCQCLLIELFCLTVLINSDHSLLISNPLTKYITDMLSKHVEITPNDGNFFSVMVIETGKSGYHISFSQYAYMAESIFFIYMISMLSYITRGICMFLFLRPILVRDDIFTMVKNIKKTGKKKWAILGTLVMLFISVGVFISIPTELSFHIFGIISIQNWIYYSIPFISIAIANILILFRFMEDWYKLIFRKF